MVLYIDADGSGGCDDATADIISVIEVGALTGDTVALYSDALDEEVICNDMDERIDAAVTGSGYTDYGGDAVTAVLWLNDPVHEEARVTNTVNADGTVAFDFGAAAVVDNEHWVRLHIDVDGDGLCADGGADRMQSTEVIFDGSTPVTVDHDALAISEFGCSEVLGD